MGIGSSQYSHTLENPFTADERRSMITLSLKNLVTNCTIISIPDIHNYSKWVEHVARLCPSFERVYSSNIIVKQLFEEGGYEVRSIDISCNDLLSASSIRERICTDQEWEKHVPTAVVDVIYEIKGVERLKKLYLQEKLKFPRTAADVIIELYNLKKEFQGVVFIERLYKPFGIAFPGGMQEYGEAIETTAKREAKEETGLEVVMLEPLEFRSDPKRDPRDHTNSMIFIAKAYGEPKASSDAKNILVRRLEEVNEDFRNKMVFDHALIWESYLKRRSAK